MGSEGWGCTLRGQGDSAQRLNNQSPGWRTSGYTCKDVPETLTGVMSWMLLGQVRCTDRTDDLEGEAVLPVGWQVLHNV